MTSTVPYLTIDTDPGQPSDAAGPPDRHAHPESLSVYGSVLLRGALAAAQHDDRATAHETLAEAVGAAHRLGTDANLRGTAFGR